MPERRRGPGRPAATDHGPGTRQGSRPASRQGHPARPGARPSTSWDRVAEWYLGWVGERGSKHHRQLAIPAVMDALALRPGEQVLDVGSGQGVLARDVLDARAEYTGVDASERLLAAGRSTYGTRARFLAGDAAELVGGVGLAPASYDAVVFMLSLQDMEPLEAVIDSAAQVLRDGGRLVILMTHPAFRIPRQSGWGWDEGRKLRYRRVDAYCSRMTIPLSPVPGRTAVGRTFHRPLGAYVNALSESGLMVDRLDETPTYKVARTGPTAQADNASNREIPLFLLLRAIKWYPPVRGEGGE